VRGMQAEALVRAIEDFLLSARCCGMEEGIIAFDLANAKYSVSGERNKCLLHLWSAERNVVRRAMSAERWREVIRVASASARIESPIARVRPENSASTWLLAMPRSEQPPHIDQLA
jgi:hypothetical protein